MQIVDNLEMVYGSIMFLMIFLKHLIIIEVNDTGHSDLTQMDACFLEQE